MGQSIHTPNTLQCADTECVLRGEIAGINGFDLTAGLIIVLYLLQRLNLGYG